MEIEAILQASRSFFETGVTKAIPFRRKALERLRDAIKANEHAILCALEADLGKAPFEGYATEVSIVLSEIKHMLKHLNAYTRQKRVRSTITNFPSKSYIIPEPYGVVLIMSPWNYPFQLTIAPLVAAIAAGNVAIVKPSAYSSATSSVIASLLQEVFETGYVSVVTGGRKENETLLENKVDYICFTGSVAVGKTVMAAAAKHLTPVTLELGGKSPCIVDETANIPLAAKRLSWGKFLNAGQTCVAPDYLYVHESVATQMITELQKCIALMYGDAPLQSVHLPKIINEKHFNRLMSLIEDAKCYDGGNADAITHKIAPTLLGGINWNHPVMQEEIFGPILPVMTYQNLNDVIATIKAHPKPLALYLFTSSGENERQVLSEVSFGGGCVNDTVMHLATPHLPFGGVGDSGMGAYHGKAGFNTFTHYKSILNKFTWMDVPLRYAPYTAWTFKLLKKL